jgi:histidinol-phosphate aminotransferase
LTAYLNKQSKTSLSVENIWAANGSNEILQSIFLAFGSAKAIGFIPSYSMHPLIGKVANVEWVDGERNPDFTLNLSAAINQVKDIKPALTFVTTPNNPTGTAITISEIEELAKAAATINGLLIVDEAYAEFSNEVSAITLIGKYPNLLVSRTMSKAFAFAGARLGYLAANKSVVDAIQLVRLPYHLSALTQAAAEVALDFQDELLAEVTKLATDRDELSQALVKLGLNVVPSDANFILFSGFKLSSNELWQKLLADGVLIRDVGLPGYLRVTIGNDAENQSFLKALEKAL